MRTARFSTVSHRILGSYPPPVHISWGKGASTQPGGVEYPPLGREWPPGGGGWVPPLWTELLTDARENITFPQLRCRVVIIGSAFMRHHFSVASTSSFHAWLVLYEWQRQTTCYCNFSLMMGISNRCAPVWELYKITMRIIQLSRNIQRENITFYFGLKLLHIFRILTIRSCIVEISGRLFWLKC